MFEVSTELTCLTSSLVAPGDVVVDLLYAEEKGEAALGEFVRARINSEEVDFHNALKKLKPKTFNQATQQTIQKTANLGKKVI